MKIIEQISKVIRKALLDTFRLDLEKGVGHKYISKRKVNGKWQYTYADSKDKKTGKTKDSEINILKVFGAKSFRRLAAAKISVGDAFKLGKGEEVSVVGSSPTHVTFKSEVGKKTQTVSKRRFIEMVAQSHVIEASRYVEKGISKREDIVRRATAVGDPKTILRAKEELAKFKLKQGKYIKMQADIQRFGKTQTYKDPTKKIKDTPSDKRTKQAIGIAKNLYENKVRELRNATDQSIVEKIMPSVPSWLSDSDKKKIADKFRSNFKSTQSGFASSIRNSENLSRMLRSRKAEDNEFAARQILSDSEAKFSAMKEFRSIQNKVNAKAEQEKKASESKAVLKSQKSIINSLRTKASKGNIRPYSDPIAKRALMGLEAKGDVKKMPDNSYQITDQGMGGKGKAPEWPGQKKLDKEKAQKEKRERQDKARKEKRDKESAEFKSKMKEKDDAAKKAAKVDSAKVKDLKSLTKESTSLIKKMTYAQSQQASKSWDDFNKKSGQNAAFKKMKKMNLTPFQSAKMQNDLNYNAFKTVVPAFRDGDHSLSSVNMKEAKANVKKILNQFKDES